MPGAMIAYMPNGGMYASLAGEPADTVPLQRRKTTLAGEEELVHFHPKLPCPGFQRVKSWFLLTLFDRGNVI